MFALWVGAISIDFFTFRESIWYLGMIIVGGLGSVPGTVFGVIFIRVLELVVQWIGPLFAAFFTEYIAGAIKSGASHMFFGLAILVFLIFEPLGLAHRWEIFKHFYRRWPFSY